MSLKGLVGPCDSCGRHVGKRQTADWMCPSRRHNDAICVSTKRWSPTYLVPITDRM